jgi:hypothetical protein
LSAADSRLASNGDTPILPGFLLRRSCLAAQPGPLGRRGSGLDL